MSTASDFREIVARLRGWGFRVVEVDGCYSRSNGLSWKYGKPVGHVNHHYVCGMNPAQSYIDSLVQGLASGSTVNWFGDVNGVAYLIGVGPMNHAGQGESRVLNRTLAGLAPTGPSNVAGDMTGNTYYSGTELQHPGDSTPYPQPMVAVMQAINAAEFIQWGLPAAAAISHYEWSGRKIDMSLNGGRASSVAGNELRANVAALMSRGGATKNTNTQPREWDEMASKDEVKESAAAGSYATATNPDVLALQASAFLNAPTGLIDPNTGKSVSVAGIFAQLNGRLQAIEAALSPKA